MSEQEWLECDNSEVMLEFVRSKASKRKLQLFAGACFRRLVYLLPDQRQLKAIEALENVSEGAELPPGVGNRVRMPCLPARIAWAGNARTPMTPISSP